VSQDFKDFYSILNIAFGATEAEIKTAYRKLARELHPDLHPEDTEQYTKLFQEVTEAYETLSDPDRKNIYDLKFRQLVLLEGPQYEYVPDTAPPDTKNYKHKYTYRNRATFSFASVGAVILIGFQLLKLLMNTAPIEDSSHHYPRHYLPLSPAATISQQTMYHKPVPAGDSLSIPYSGPAFMNPK